MHISFANWLHTMPFIPLVSWLAGWACKNSSVSNLWRFCLLLVEVTNPYSSKSENFQQTTLSAGKRRRVVVVPKIKWYSTLEERKPLNYKEKQQIRGSIFIMNKRWALLSKVLTFSSFSELNESKLLSETSRHVLVISFEGISTRPSTV